MVNKMPTDRRIKGGKIKPSAPRSLVEIVTSDEVVDTIPLFSIDGVVYSIPAEVSASMALRVLDESRKNGQEAAMAGALEELLGEDAYQALLSCKSLKVSDLEKIMEAVQVHVLGDLEGALGN